MNQHTETDDGVYFEFTNKDGEQYIYKRSAGRDMLASKNGITYLSDSHTIKMRMSTLTFVDVIEYEFKLTESQFKNVDRQLRNI